MAKKLVLRIRTALSQDRLQQRVWLAGVAVSLLLTALAFGIALADSPRFPQLPTYSDGHPPFSLIAVVIAVYLLNPPVLLLAFVVGQLSGSLLLVVVLGIPLCVWWWRYVSRVFVVSEGSGALLGSRDV